MVKPRHVTLSLLGVLFIGAAGSVVLAQQQPSTAQSAERERGIQLYEQGDLKRAVEALRAVVKKNQDDLIAWNYLALALERKGDKKERRKALSRVADLRIKLFQKEFDTAGENMTAADLSRLELLHKEASESVGNYLGADAAPSNLQYWTDSLNGLIIHGKFLELAKDALAQGRVLRWSEVPKNRARVLKKDEPPYTEEARRHQVSGTILLSAIFDADGTIKGIRVVKGLGGGLVEVAIETARRIKFQPAAVGGQPVSQYVVIEYSFNVF